MSKTDKGNPTALIQTQLQVLRTERERTTSLIYSLEQEKKSIMKILPKIYYELSQMQTEIEGSTKEAAILDHSIEEIEKNYGDFLFSAHFFGGEGNN